MLKALTVAIAAWVILASPLGDGHAAEKQGGGAFTKTKPNKQTVKTPERARNTDGTYRIAATRVIKHKKLACLSSYTMVLVVKNGRASHKLPFGHTLLARARGSQLLITSHAEEGGGHWLGRITLPKRNGRKASGFLKWVGDDLRCEFRVSVSKQ